MGFPKPLSHVLINELSAALPQQKEATRQPLRDKHIAKKKNSTTQTAPKLCVELNDEIWTPNEAASIEGDVSGILIGYIRRAYRGEQVHTHSYRP